MEGVKIMRLSEALQALISNPDDLSNLPQLVARAQELENAEEDYQTRISTLQEINRKYLAQIPIPGQEQEQKEETNEEPTLQDAKAYLEQALKGDK